MSVEAAFRVEHKKKIKRVKRSFDTATFHCTFSLRTNGVSEQRINDVTDKRMDGSNRCVLIQFQMYITKICGMTGKKSHFRKNSRYNYKLSNLPSDGRLVEMRGRIEKNRSLTLYKESIKQGQVGQ